MEPKYNQEDDEQIQLVQQQGYDNEEQKREYRDRSGGQTDTEYISSRPKEMHMMMRSRKCTFQMITTIIGLILLFCILISLVLNIIIIQMVDNNQTSSSSSSSSSFSTNYGATVTFTLCNVDESTSESLLKYKQIFSRKFGISQDAINPSIQIGDFCSFRGRRRSRRRNRRRLQDGIDGNDQEVTISVPTDNAMAADQTVEGICDEIQTEIDPDNCESFLSNNGETATITNLDALQEQCMAESCDYKLMDLEIHNKSSLRILTLPSALLPGYQFLSYSFNLFQGMPPTDLILEGYYRQIIDFTFEKEQVSSGTNDFLVPDQFDLPSISGVCTKQSSTSSVSSSMSTSSMTREAYESTGTESFEASVEASGWGFSVSASTAMSSSFSNSRANSASRSAARSGKSKSSYTYSKALLYSTQLQWDTIKSYRNEFKEAISNLSDLNSTLNETEIYRQTILFIGNFGTHVLDLARMGARCRQTTYYSSSMSSESYSYTSELSSSSSNYDSYSSSISGGAFGFSASASAAYASSSTQGNSESTSGSFEESSTVEYSSERIDCIGEVDITSACGDLLGTQNQPSLVGYRLKAIWDLPIFDEDAYEGNYSTAKINLLNGLTKIDKAAEICGKDNCGGLGICAIDRTFWTSLKYKRWNYNSSFNEFWDNDTCLNQYEIGQSMMRSGYGIRTQMSQCNSSEQVKWGERCEISAINYDPFCDKSMQIAIGLNLFNRSIDFSARISNEKKDSFKITYGLLSVFNPYECTTIGGVSYAMFCENTIVRVNRFNNIGDLGRDGVSNVFYKEIEPSPSLNCSYLGDYWQVQAIAVIAGYNFTHSGQMGVDSISVFNQNSIIVVYYVPSQTIGDRGETWVDFSVIMFCNDSSAIRNGTIEINLDNTDVIPNTLPSPYLYRKWIKYEPIALSCKYVNVFIAFSWISGNMNCPMSVWSENESGAGFSMVFGIWDGYQSNITLNCLSNANEKKVIVSWMAICQNL